MTEHQLINPLAEGTVDDCFDRLTMIAKNHCNLVSERCSPTMPLFRGVLAALVSKRDSGGFTLSPCTLGFYIHPKNVSLLLDDPKVSEMAREELSALLLPTGHKTHLAYDLQPATFISQYLYSVSYMTRTLKAVFGVQIGGYQR